MESINIFKGYGKVNTTSLEDQNLHRQQRTTKKPFFTTLTIAATILLTLILCLMIAALIYESTTEPPESPFLPSSNPAESIKAVCDVTQYPSSCFTSISSLNTSIKRDPETIFKLSLQVSIKELTTLSSSLKTLNDVKSQAAINDCVSQLGDAMSSLNESLRAMEVGPGEKALTLEKVKDIQTWISAAMTNQDTCLDGLQEMGSNIIDEFKEKMEKPREFLSNSLAIIAKMQSLLEKFDLTMH